MGVAVREDVFDSTELVALDLPLVGAREVAAPSFFEAEPPVAVATRRAARIDDLSDVFALLISLVDLVDFR